VHRGHQQIVAELVSRARDAGVQAVAVTFDPHPIALLRPGLAPPLLSTIEDRAAWLGDLGVDILVAMPTTADLLALDPREFFEQVVVGQLGVAGMVEGPNFCFGRDRAGGVDVLAELCGEAGVSLQIVDGRTVDGDLVSSSRIRACLEEGDVTGAACLLGRNHSVSGTVVQGAGRGREMGVPTANVGQVPTMLPADGVYAGAVEWEGMRYPAAAHVGANPTFSESGASLEVHLLAFDGDLYGSHLRMSFLDRIRGTRTFESVEALKQQLAEDIEAVWRLVADETAGSGATGGAPAGPLS